MRLKYLHFNIFGLALSEMATSTGSLNNRLIDAYFNFLYKLDWEKDVKLMPDELARDFRALKKILHDDLLIALEKDREKLAASYARLNIPMRKEKLYELDSRSVLRGYNWTKSKKAAELISKIYFSLGYAIK